MERLVALTHAGAASVTLDVACGPGRLTRSFAQHAQRSVGIDTTGALLDIARSEAQAAGVNNVEYVEGSALDLPFAAETYDVVSCRAAFHHFDQPQAVLSEMTRVLRSDGQLLIADILGNRDDVKAERHDALEQLCDPTHVRCIPEAAFQAMFAACGLRGVAEHKRSVSYVVDSWILHGGPTPAVAEQIKQRFQSDLDGDQAGMAVRVEDGQLKFSHNTVVYVAAKA